MVQRDVFISHSSADADQARELRAVLEGAGYTCWMAPDDIVGTETWTEQILAAIADSKVMVVLVSAGANASPHVSREVNLALGRKRAVLPIRIEAVAPEGPLEYLLSLVQRLDAFPPPLASHGPQILRRLESIVARPQTTPLPGPTTETGPMDAPSEGEKPKARTRARPKKTDGAATPEPGPDPGHDPDAAAPEDGSTATSTRRRSNAELGAGSVVGGFTIESQLGEGGMATVYRARQDEPRRLVALKVIRADHAANDTYRRRFLEEKETLAALEHPSIVPIYAAGEADGVLFIAMRLVDGPDLQARIKSKGRLSLRETVQILEPIADAVDYAHEMGVVHRDLKPSNIILDRDARPYLTDFGLGKRLEVDSQLSMPGMAIGTLDYMAPEQFKGNADPKLAPAIDLYALGCVAFQCLTGQAPFVRSSPNELMYAHANEPPPAVTALQPEYPAAIDAIFARVLAKDPAARFGSAREFIANLEAVVSAAATGSTSPVVVTTGTTPVAKARTWVGGNTALAVGGAAVALVAVVVLGAGLIFGKPAPTASPTPAPTPSPVITAAPTPTPKPTPVITEPPVETVAPTQVSGAFPNAFEEQLLDMQPPTVVDTSTCLRDDNKYPEALAMISCDAPGDATGSVYFALYDGPASLTASYKRILESEGIAEDSGPGCFELDQSNRTWIFTGDETVQGLLACYPRTSGSVSGIQYIWTMDRHDVLALWLSPSYEDGLSLFQDWAANIER